MRENIEVKETIEKYGDMVKRISILYLKNSYDTEDVFQNVFLKYALSNKNFDGEEHKKAWIARVSINECKDMLKSFYKKNFIPVEHMSSLVEHCDNSEDYAVLEAVLSLPDKYKNVIYLYYFEGYKGKEIAKIMKKSEEVIYKWLSRGRKLLEKKLGGDLLE